MESIARLDRRSPIASEVEEDTGRTGGGVVRRAMPTSDIAQRDVSGKSSTNGIGVRTASHKGLVAPIEGKKLNSAHHPGGDP
jgi:hypothetical protein